MTIDISTRFPRTTTREAYERSQELERWVFPDTICSSVTMIYGRSSVGKSYLVSSLLLSLLVEDREFLGMQPTDQTKLWKPAILWTDPGSDEEYGERIHRALPEGVDVEIPIFHIGRTARAEEWEALTGYLLEEGCNFVVVDNLMGATGDTNDAAVLTTVFDGLTRLTNRGVPVVVLHHESEKGFSAPGGNPMGSSIAVQKSRVWIQVRQSNKRRQRGGNTALIVQSNSFVQPLEIVAEPMQGPDYRVLHRGPWVTKADVEPEESGRDRGNSTLDRNAAAAEFVIGKCQGVGVNATAKKLAEEFPDLQEASWKTSLTQGSLSKMLSRTGAGKTTVWSAA